MGRYAKSEASFREREFSTPILQPAQQKTIKKIRTRPKQQSKQASIPPSTYEQNQVFVIMSFDGDEMDYVFKAIKEQCRKHKLRALRVDEMVGSGLVIKDILTLIEQAEFIICDLTYERPNVYYELGYAHGVGNDGSNILLIAKKGTVLHFDIAPLRVLFYRDTTHLQNLVNPVLRKLIHRKRYYEKQ